MIVGCTWTGETPAASRPAAPAPPAQPSESGTPRDSVSLSGKASPPARPLRLVAIGDSLTAGTQDANTVQERQRLDYSQQLADAAAMQFNMGLIGGEGLPFTVFGNVGFDQKKFARSRGRLMRALAPLALYTYYMGVLPFVPPVWGILGLGFRTGESKDTRQRPQTNFAVPSYKLRELIDVRTVKDLLREMHRGTEKVDGFASVIPWTRALLQNGSYWDRGSQVDQAVRANPDVMIVWGGNNDALGPIFNSHVDDQTLTPIEDRPWTYKDTDLVTGRSKMRTTPFVMPGFRSTLDRILKRCLDETHADIMLMNIPDVTVVPILREMGKPVGPLPFRVHLSDGTEVTHELENWVIPDLKPGGGHYPAGSRVSLINVLDKFLSEREVTTKADFVGTLTKLAGQATFTDDDVLDPSEMLTIADRVREFNQLLADAAASNPRIHLVDVHRSLNEVQLLGHKLRGTGPDVVVSSGFTGTHDPQGRDGIFSYDGVHPSDTGHAVVANLVLDRMKEDFKNDPRFAYLQTVAPVDEKAVYFHDPHRTRQDGIIVLDRVHVDALKRGMA